MHRPMGHDCGGWAVREGRLSWVRVFWGPGAGWPGHPFSASIKGILVLGGGVGTRL